jgi:hypothetical protein
MIGPIGLCLRVFTLPDSLGRVNPTVHEVNDNLTAQ